MPSRQKPHLPKVCMKACQAVKSHTYRKCTQKPAKPLKAAPTESVPRLTKACPEPELLSLTVRYQSPMNLRQVRPALSSFTTPFPSQSPFCFHHISDTPPFIPVPLVSPFVPMFPIFTDICFHVTMILSSLAYSFSPRSCLSLFHASTFCS